MDLEYLEELHDVHNSYPLAPEKKVIKISRSRAGSAPGEQRENGSDLEDKENYVVHHKNLQFYPRQEMRLKKGAPSDRVRSRALDEATHQDEHGVPQAGKTRF